MPSKKKKPGKSLKKYASLFSKIAFDPPPKEPGMARSNESVAKYERDLADYVNKRDEKLKEEREEKLPLVFECYDLEHKEANLKKLCLSLCEEIFTGFQLGISKERGATKWNVTTRAILFLEVKIYIYRIYKGGNHPIITIEDAAKKLVSQPRWKKKLAKIPVGNRVKRLQDEYSKAHKEKSIILFEQHLDYLIQKNTPTKIFLKELTETLQSLTGEGST